MNNNLIALYNIIFQLQIALIGIILPLLFVFVQLMNKEHSFYHIQSIIESYKLKIYLIISIIIIIISGLGSYFLSIVSFNFFENYNFHAKEIITNNCFSISIILIFLLNFLHLLKFLYTSIKEINPIFYIKQYLSNISIESLKIYLYKNYGLPYFNTHKNLLIKISKLKINKSEINEEIIESDFEISADGKLIKIKDFDNNYLISKDGVLDINNSDAEDNEKNKKEEEYFELIEAQIIKDYKPIFDIPFNILNYNISNYFLIDFNQCYDVYIEYYFDSYKILKRENTEENNLCLKLTIEYCNKIKLLFQISLSKNGIIFYNKFLDANNEMFNFLIGNDDNISLIASLNTFESFIDLLDSTQENECNKISEILNHISADIFKTFKNNSAKTIEEYLSIFSKISEKIIHKYNLKKQPLMMNIDSKYIYDNIINGLYEIFSLYKNHIIEKNPSILLDLNYCIFKAILDKVLYNRSGLINEYFKKQSILFIFEPIDLLKEYLKTDNYKNACYCIIRIFEILGDLNNLYSHLLKEYLEYIFEIGIIINSKNEKDKCELIPEGIDEYIINKIKEFNFYFDKSDHFFVDLRIKYGHYYKYDSIGKERKVKYFNDILNSLINK